MRYKTEPITPHFSRAVFLDRDGTLNEDTHYPHRVDEVAILSGVFSGLSRLSRLPVHLLVASNQSGIARGIFTKAEMSLFHQDIRRPISVKDGRIDGFYYCPHAEPNKDASGALSCKCRKPQPGLLLKAARDYCLDLTQCFLVGDNFLVGDKKSDIAAGQAVGACTVLVLTGKAGTDEHLLTALPDAVVPNLEAAAMWIEEQLANESSS